MGGRGLPASPWPAGLPVNATEVFRALRSLAFPKVGKRYIVQGQLLLFLLLSAAV